MIHSPLFTFFQVARQPARQSLQNSACLGRHQGDLPIFHGVVADKQCTCPASKPMWERYPPTPPAFARNAAAGEGCRAGAQRAKAGLYAFGHRATARQAISLRETRPMHRDEPHKLIQVGATPTPATNSREVIRRPVRKTGVFKQAGSDDWSITSTSQFPDS